VEETGRLIEWVKKNGKEDAETVERASGTGRPDDAEK
jgi:hypothetical protein